MPDRRVVVVGRGRLGSRLAAALGARLVPGREPIPRDALRSAEIVVLAVPDPAIELVATRIAPALTAEHVVLHCAGSRGADVLRSCAEAGAAVGMMHPLIAIASDASVLVDRTFVVDGDARAVHAAEALVARVGARPLVAPLHGPAYHAAAALVANGSTALASVAARVLELLGASRSDAERAIAGLLASVAQNVASVGLPRALTGPVIRGDATTVARHREALAAVDRDALATYDAITPTVLGVAREAGLEPSACRAIQRALRADVPSEVPSSE